MTIPRSLTPLIPADVTKLWKSFERLEKQKETVMTSLTRWSEAAKTFRPDPGSWSALDVVDHIVRVERESLAAINSNLTEKHEVGMREKIGARVVFVVMWSPLKIKVPASVQSVLPGESPGEDHVISKWNEVRRNFRMLLEQLESADLKNGLFRHPVCGWMTIGDAITFLSTHTIHHEHQLRRIHKRFAAIQSAH